MLERAQQLVDTLFGLSDTRPPSNDAAIIVVAVHSLILWLNVYLYHSLQRLRVRTRERSFNSSDNYKHTHISLHTRAFVPLVSLLLYQAQTQTKNLFSLCFHSHAKEKFKNKVKDKSKQNTKKISPPGNLFQCRFPHAQRKAGADQIGGEHQGSRQAANSPGNIILRCNYFKTKFKISFWSP